MEEEISYEIDLTEAEVEKLLDDAGEDEAKTMCARAKDGTDLRFPFDGFYAEKKERKQALKQSLVNVDVIHGKKGEGFFFRYPFLNSFEKEALLLGLKARYFFSLVELFRLQDHASNGLSFESFVTTKIPTEETRKDEKKRTQYPFTLFKTNFTLRTSFAINTAVKETIRFYDNGCSGRETGLCNCAFSKLANHARYRIAKILLEEQKLEEFCFAHFSKKRTTSLHLLEEAAPKKLKTENNTETVSTESGGGARHCLCHRPSDQTDDLPAWIMEKIDELRYGDIPTAQHPLSLHVAFHIIKTVLRFPKMKRDIDEEKRLIAELYLKNGENAIFNIFDWNCNSLDKFLVYTSPAHVSNYGDFYEAQRRCKYTQNTQTIFSTLNNIKNGKEVLLNIIIENKDGGNDDLIVTFQMLGRYSYSLNRRNDEIKVPAASVEETSS